MAGDYLFGAHWEAGFALRILDRSDARGSFTNKITSQRLATVATSQDTGGCTFSASHYCPSGLYNTRGYDFGFYIYYGQGAVYDPYWSEYAIWVVSNDNLYFRSTDGAIVALTSGNPQALAAAQSTPHAAQYAARNTEYATGSTPLAILDSLPIARIPHTEARAWAGQTVTVTGVVREVLNNGKQVMLNFAKPHQGHFKVLILREHWGRFADRPDRLYRAGDAIAVRGVIGWYQGDPVIRAAQPEQIVVAR